MLARQPVVQRKGLMAALKDGTNPRRALCWRSGIPEALCCRDGTDDTLLFPLLIGDGLEICLDGCLEGIHDERLANKLLALRVGRKGTQLWRPADD